MDYEIFNIFKDYTLEVILIGLGAFLLTYLIKWPIKKATEKLDENKRKAVNIVIIFIPLIISIIASILYYGIAKNVWATFMVFDSAFSSWIISLSLYAIVSRIWLVIKGIFSGKIKLNSELTKETIEYFKDKIKNISKELKVDEKSLTNIVNKIEELAKLRDLLTSDTINPDITKIAEVNTQISNLETKQKTLQDEIDSKINIINGYNDKLYQKTITSTEKLV